MDEEIKKLEIIINKYFIYLDKVNLSIFSKNISLFYFICSKLLSCFYKFNIKNPSMVSNFEINYDEISKVTLDEKIKIIKNFYMEHNISFDIDKYISDGTIDFDFDVSFQSGFQHYTKDNHKLIEVCNNGLITDIPVMIHEFSHLRNQPDHNRNSISDLFTEVLASTEELIFIDYMDKIGYKKEALMLKKLFLKCASAKVYRCQPVLKMLKLFDDFGSISKENYSECYNTPNLYEEEINNIKKFNYNYDIHIDVYYVFSYFLAPYLYYQYKKDNNFINNINELNDAINNSHIDSCLKLMNLKDLGNKDKDKIMDSFNDFLESTFLDKKLRNK